MFMKHYASSWKCKIKSRGMVGGLVGEQGGSEPRIEIIVKMQKKSRGVGMVGAW